MMLRAFIYRLLKAVLFCVFLLALAGFSMLATIRYIEATGEVATPDLMNHDLVYAADLLAERHLHLKMVDAQYDTRIAQDRIVAQEPAPGIMIKKNRTIRVIVSKGTEASTIPDVVQKRWQEATSTLKQHKFRVGYVGYVHSSEAPTDHIIAQTPPPGAAVSQGAQVHLLVSLGPAKNMMVMPDLVEEQLEYGLQVIGQLGLVLGKIERDADFPIAPNTIISQVPKPGTLIQEQNIVNLVVSRSGLPKDPAPAPVVNIQYATVDYLVPLGRFAREVTVVVKNAEGVAELFRQVIPPGRQISVRVPVVGETVVEIALDGILDDIRRFNHE